MKAEIKYDTSVIIAAYMGSSIIFPAGLNTKSEGSKFIYRDYGRLSSLNLKLSPSTYYDLVNNPESGAKLLLRRMTDITDEEAINLAKILAGDFYTTTSENPIERTDKSIAVWTGGYGVVKIFDSMFNFTNREFNISTASVRGILEAVDFLRSSGIDIGYGEIPSLIDAGIAIMVEK